MNRRFTGQRALVTGASRGIGAAIAARLASEGADVAIVARTLTKHDHLDGSLEEAAAVLRQFGGKVVVITADLTNDENWGRKAMIYIFTDTAIAIGAVVYFAMGLLTPKSISTGVATS